MRALRACPAPLPVAAAAVAVALSFVATPAAQADTPPRSGTAAEHHAAPAGHDAVPAVTGVNPSRDTERLLCDVRTVNLPGSRIASSLESGLPSAIEMDLDLLDTRDRIVRENRIFLRVMFDLWEEVFRVEGAGAVRDFPDLASLQGYLDAIPQLPVAGLGTLDLADRHRIRVGMQLHPIAPRETERLGDWVAGEGTAGGETEDPDGREVSVRFGDLIRFFYKGARRDTDGSSERFSAWFVPENLPAPEAPAAKSAVPHEEGHAPDQD